MNLSSVMTNPSFAKDLKSSESVSEPASFIFSNTVFLIGIAMINRKMIYLLILVLH